MSTEVNIKNNNGGKIVSTAIVVLLIAALSCAYLFYIKWHDAKAKLKSSENNKELLVKSINGLQDSSKILKLKMDGQKINAAEYNTLYLDKQNIESQLSDKMKTIKALGVNIDNLESCVTQQVTTVDTIHTIAYVDSLQSLCASYRDSFIDISTTIYRDRRSIITYKNNEIFDLLNYKSHKHKFLFIKWGKIDKFVLVPHNPKTKVSIRAVKIIDE
jgi:hypothetical protein